MIKFIIQPDFDFKLGEKEAGDYLIILPQINAPIWSMWCSSLTWLTTDLTYPEIDETIKFLFGDIVYDFILDLNKTISLKDISRDNEAIDIVKYYKLRPQIKIPAWCNKDKFQKIF